jgi:uncharacterized protein (DUF488 family)
MSDSRKFSNKDAGFIVVKGLNFIPLYHCPHFDRDVKRKDVLSAFLKKTHKKWIVLDEGTAFLIENTKRRIVKSKEKANAYLYYLKRGKIVSKILDVVPLQKLSELK